MLETEYGVRHKPLSAVGAHTETGELACPKCGGTQFTAKRSITGKILGGVLAPKTMVRCVTCATTYRRA